MTFGPVGEGPASSTTAGYDRSFIKEWQTNPPEGLSHALEGEPRRDQGRHRPLRGYRRQPAAFRRCPSGIEPGATDPAVAILRRRLTSVRRSREDSSYPDYFGSELETAVKRFQASNGLAPTGIVDKRTIAALNVPAEVRLEAAQGQSRRG